MGIDAAIFAIRAKKYLYIDRETNIDPAFFEFGVNRSMYKRWKARFAATLDGQTDALSRYSLSGIDRRVYTIFERLVCCGVNAEELIDLASSGAKSEHMCWNKDIVLFAAENPDDWFVLHNDASEPNFHDVARNFDYVRVKYLDGDLTKIGDKNMPKKMEKALKKMAKKKGMKGKRAAAYIYGTMRKTGWKPKAKKR